MQKDRRLGASAADGLREQYRALAAMEERARRRALQSMIVDEICEDANEMRRQIRNRLEAWIALAAQDREGARRVAESYNAVAASLMDQLELRALIVMQGVIETEVWFDLWLSRNSAG
jgi:hypothetical protein